MLPVFRWRLWLMKEKSYRQNRLLQCVRIT
jgi:hypothetical protein